MTDILNIDQNLNLKHPQHFGGGIYFRLQVESTLVGPSDRIIFDGD